MATRTMGLLPFLRAVILFCALFGFSQFTGAHRGQAVHNCPYGVWCAIVAGYALDDPTPLNERPLVQWVNQPRGQVLVSHFPDYPTNTGIAMMCTRDSSTTNPLVTQLEYTWKPPGEEQQTYFDVSSVAGDPFVNEGFNMTAKDPVTPVDPRCYGAYCAPGDSNCNQVYAKSNDNFSGMRTCSDEVDLFLTLCSG